MRTILILLAVLALALTLALGRTIARLREGPSFGGPATADEELAAAAIRQLVAQGPGLLDSDADPDIGRRLLPSLQNREIAGIALTTNEWGLRERELEEKAEGTVRVVLLGDSLVFGAGVAAEERMGARLEAFLDERAIAEVTVECLHVGVPGWNVHAAGSFLRRTLPFFDPDLVVHFIQSDDLGDVRGVRGFGSEADFAPGTRAYAGGVVDGRSAAWPNPIAYALDHEGRERYARVAQDVGRIASTLRELGRPYLLVSCWEAQPLAREHFAPVLDERELAYVAQDFLADTRVCVSPNGPPWNAAGHEAIAQLLYGLLQERELLPCIELPPWPEARAAVERIHGAGVADARGKPPRAPDPTPASELAFDSGAVELPAQVYGGIRGNAVAPRASLVLRNARDGAARAVLVLRGERLARRELHGQAHAFVEGRRVGSFSLEGSGEIAERFALPQELADRPFLSVRFEADDYVYLTAAGDCASFRLSSVALD